MIRHARVGAGVRLLGAGALLAIASAPAIAPAQEEVVRATVVRIEDQDLFVDLGTPAARPGLTLEVFRAIEVRHPITKRLLRDRYPIGRVSVVQPGETLSIVRLSGNAARTIEVGDVVETRTTVLQLPAAPPERAPAAAPPGAGEPAAPPAVCPPATCPPALPCPPCDAIADPESATILIVFRATLGRPPQERLAVYQQFRERHPRSRWLGFVDAEIATLTRMIAAGRPAAPPTPEEQRRQRLEALADAVDVLPCLGAREGDPVHVAARLDPSTAVRGVVLHVAALPPVAEVTSRAVPESYRSVPMVLDGRGHARARVPQEMVRVPGFAYWLEAVGADGVAVPAHHTAAAPERVPVRSRRPDGYDPRGRSRVRAVTEFVSFDGMTPRDWYLLAEGEFLYRIKWLAFHGLRVGYGHYRGQGGTVESLDVLREAPHDVGFTYGYVETELHHGDVFAVMSRVTLGLGRGLQDDLGADRVRGGFQLRVRIGAEEGTNLVLAGETLPEIGQRAFLGLSWESIAGFPMAAEVHVTDQPVNSGELGVRGVFEVGWEPIPAIGLSARLSYQGRTIDHAGPGFGLAATFDW